MTPETKHRKKAEEVKAMLAGDPELVRELMRIGLQEMLEAEMNEALGAGKHERTGSRRGYRSGYYERTLNTRVGPIELRGHPKGT